jgi:hypothetical protein
MFRKSVSPRFVFVATVLVGLLLALVLVPIELALIRHLGLRKEQYKGPYCPLIVIFASLYLVPRALSSLGIRVRGRSVERLQASDRNRRDAVADELPIRIERGGSSLVGVMRNVLFFSGLACLVLAACLLFTWFPPPGPRADASLFTLGLLEMGGLLLGGAFLARYGKPELLCEISEKGIRAPDGFWGRETFVPWENLARCEIIHDERIWHDHFVIWDRAGRRRFRSSKNWMGRMRRSDRDQILRALRSRFVQKEKPGPDLEPVLIHRAAAAVWDRELDG